MKTNQVVVVVAAAVVVGGGTRNKVDSTVRANYTRRLAVVQAFSHTVSVSGAMNEWRSLVRTGRVQNLVFLGRCSARRKMEIAEYKAIEVSRHPVTASQFVFRECERNGYDRKDMPPRCRSLSNSLRSSLKRTADFSSCRDDEMVVSGCKQLMLGRETCNRTGLWPPKCRLRRADSLTH